jgi:hypothetical protein
MQQQKEGAVQPEQNAAQFVTRLRSCLLGQLLIATAYRPQGEANGSQQQKEGAMQPEQNVAQFVTRLAFQDDMLWLKAVAWRNMLPMLVTLEVSKLSNG